MEDDDRAPPRLVAEVEAVALVLRDTGCHRSVHRVHVLRP